MGESLLTVEADEFPMGVTGLSRSPVTHGHPRPRMRCLTVTPRARIRRSCADPVPPRETLVAPQLVDAGQVQDVAAGPLQAQPRARPPEARAPRCRAHSGSANGHYASRPGFGDCDGVRVGAALARARPALMRRRGPSGRKTGWEAARAGERWSAHGAVPRNVTPQNVQRAAFRAISACVRASASSRRVQWKTF